METLKSKNQKIILYLLSTKEPVALSKLVSRFDISERALRYNIEEIDDFLKDYGLRLERKAGKGVRITVPPDCDIKSLAHAIESLTTRELILDADEKRSYIISRLLMLESPITIQQLADEIFVGRNTVVLLLNEVEQWFQRFNIKLIRKTNFGLKVDYTNKSWRNAMVALLGGEDNNAWYYEIADRDDVQKYIRASQNGSAFILSCRDSSGSEEEIERFHEIITELESKKNRRFDELEYSAIVFQMKIVLDRSLQGARFVLADDYIDVITALPTHSTAKALVKLMSSVLRVEIAQEETAYLALQLLSMEQMHEKNRREKGSEQIAGELVDEVLQSVVVSDMERGELVKRVALNIQYAVKSCRSNQYIYNPLFLTLVQEHRQLFEIVRAACKRVDTTYGVKLRDDEIALVASSFINESAGDAGKPRAAGLRVLVVCMNGVGTARMLSARLKTAFPNICVADTCSIMDLEKRDSIEEADLIISTVPTDKLFSVPVVTASPLLDDESISRISRFISMKNLFSIKGIPREKLTIDLICGIINKHVGTNYNRDLVRDELKMLLGFAENSPKGT